MIRRLSLAAAVLAITLAASTSTAHAEEEWYGYEIALTDAGGWGLMLAGGKLDIDPMVALGAGGLLLGGPIVHAAHGNYGRAGISFAARGGGALLGGILGFAIADRSRSDSPLSGLAAIGGVIVGAFIGYLGGAITDIAVVAREDDDPAAAPRMVSFGGRF